MQVSRFKDEPISPMKKMEFKYGLIVTTIGVSRHAINKNGEILGGEWLDDKEITQCIESINVTASANTGEKNSGIQIIPDNILLDNADFLVWYKPRFVRHVFFNQDVIKDLPHPSLVFIASKKKKNLFIMAYKGTKRPTVETQMYFAPCPNIFKGNHLCIGTARFPHFVNFNAISELEEILLGSRYTGFKFDSFKAINNNDLKTSLHSLSGLKQFPTKLLKQPNDKAYTLEQFISDAY